MIEWDKHIIISTIDEHVNGNPGLINTWFFLIGGIPQEPCFPGENG